MLVAIAFIIGLSLFVVPCVVLPLVIRLTHRQSAAAEFGYLYPDAGAFLMSCKLVWPVKQVRAALSKRKGAAMLRALGG